MDFLNFFAVFISAVISSFGIGGGSIFILYLTLFKKVEQLEAQGLNLLFFIPSALISVAVYAYKKMLSYKLLLPLIGGGILGVLLGAVLLKHLPVRYLKLGFSLFLLFVGTKTLFQKKKE